MNDADHTPDTDPETNPRTTARSRYASRYGEPTDDQPRTETDGGSTRDPEQEADDESDRGVLSAGTRAMARYGSKAKENASSTAHAYVSNHMIAVTIATIAVLTAIGPAAAQACEEGAGLFISDMQTEVGSIVLGAIALALLVGIAFLLIPFAGTSGVGWLMILAVGGGIFAYMIGFWLLGMLGDYGVMGMEEACSPFFGFIRTEVGLSLL